MAIIGAGLSGLACAWELKNHGVIPTVYEQKSRVGDLVFSAGINLRLFSRTVTDSFRFLKKKYNLELKCLSRIHQVVMTSPNKTVIIQGNLGCIFKRGIEADSLENQIAQKAQIPICFDTFARLEDIESRYDHIVVASGHGRIAKEMGVWTDTLTAQVRHATILGKFPMDTVEIYFDTRYAKNCFGYLIPVNSREASMVLIVNGITEAELDFYWNEFFLSRKIENKISEIRNTEHCCGIVNPLRKGSVSFTGNSAGFTDDLIGFGAVNAVESGILCARSIMNNLDYGKLVRPISRHIEKLHECRKAINAFSNDDYDRLMAFLDLPCVKQLIYNCPFTRATQGAFMAKAYNAAKKADTPLR